VTEDDSAEFRRAVAGTKRHKPDERAPEAMRRAKPTARFRRDNDAAVLADSLSDDIETRDPGYGGALRYQRQSVGRRTMRKLARGGYSVQAEIDLHGMTLDEAQPRLRDFIEFSAIRGHLCVRVVHGKGLGSGERGPVLKNAVNHWLRKWDNVLAFVSTRQVHGGTGAVYVLLQRA